MQLISSPFHEIVPKGNFHVKLRLLHLRVHFTSKKNQNCSFKLTNTSMSQMGKLRNYLNVHQRKTKSLSSKKVYSFNL